MVADLADRLCQEDPGVEEAAAVVVRRTMNQVRLAAVVAEEVVEMPSCRFRPIHGCLRGCQ